MDSSEFQFQFIHLNSIESTNIYAFELLKEKNAAEGVVISTDFQEKGKGQKGKSWSSDNGKNLQFSVIVSPSYDVEKQFDLSKLVAISLKFWLDSLAVPQVQIKWPNDILVNGKKIAGILIENAVQGSKISNSVIGIGLNVNQLYFERFPREATSLQLEMGKQFNRQQLLEGFLAIFQTTYQRFMKGEIDINKMYLNSLYGYGTPKRFEDETDQFLGVILGVLPNGKLQINKNGKLKSYDLKEIKFLD